MGRQHAEQVRQEKRKALQAAHEGRQELEHRHGVYEGDPVAEGREERSRDFERVVAGWLRSSLKPSPSPGRRGDDGRR
jgi:hypothetical protein